MSDRSTIEWTDATWNPVTGCSKVSPGCAHCYAETMSLRFGLSAHPWTPANATENVILRPDRLEQPLRWRRPRMVFVNSMSDLFHERVPNEYIAAVFGVMAASDDHTFQILTKRSERMKAWFDWYDDQARDMECRGAPAEVAFWHGRGHVGDLKMFEGAGFDWPLPNVWLGVSIENRRYVHRVDLLRETPAAVRFISAEPLLGPLVYDAVEDEDDGADDPYWCWHDDYDGPQLDLAGIDWLIIGGESGPRHRPVDPRWVRGLIHYAEAHGPDAPAVFFKQWGGRTPKAGGRDLDGRTWDEMPLGRGFR